MKVLVCALLAVPVFSVAQDMTVELKHVSSATATGEPPSSLKATSIERSGAYPGVIKLKGNVEIKVPHCTRTGKENALVCSSYTILRAEEADYREDTGAIQARGNVRVETVRH